MKKTLLLIAVLSAATFSFAGDDKAAADKAKCDAKSEKCCCCKCCCCAKDAKSCDMDKAACTDKKDAKPAATTPGKP
jgi:hypothetical protein